MFNNRKYFLAADAGGTKTSIAILDDAGKILIKKIYHSREIKNFTDTLLQFINQPECKKYQIKDLCIAAAGKVNRERDYARLTNADWTIDKQSILVRTKLQRVIILNDFEATGFGIDTMKPGEYVELTNFGRKLDGTIAVIGAGTGLGVSILTYEMGKHFPIPSEGGHVDIPIQIDDSTDIKLLTFLKNKKLYSDAEDIVSGRGIVNIYNFLLTQKIKHDKKISAIIKKSSTEEKPALITKYALEDKDTLCIKTLELFIKYYARVARNLALTSMCSELAISGGIAPRILPALQDVFVEEFVQHEVQSMRKILEMMTILVVVNTDLGIQGAFNVLKS